MEFLNYGLLATVAGTISIPALAIGSPVNEKRKSTGAAKNIIFLVNDGMSNGTLNMADLLLQHKMGHGSLMEP